MGRRTEGDSRDRGPEASTGSCVHAMEKAGLVAKSPGEMGVGYEVGEPIRVGTCKVW